MQARQFDVARAGVAAGRFPLIASMSKPAPSRSEGAEGAWRGVELCDVGG